VIAPDRKATGQVIANFRQVVKEGDLPLFTWHRDMRAYGPRESANQGYLNGRSTSLGLQGAGRPDFPAVTVLRVAAGATMRQACTEAGIDPDAPLVGIPAAAF
jgi:hypothetical protein